MSTLVPPPTRPAARRSAVRPAAAAPTGPVPAKPGPVVPAPGFPTPAMLAAAGDPPDGTPLSEAECLARFTRHAAEYVDGRLSYLPMASEIHQTIALFLWETLRDAARDRGHDPKSLVAPFFLRIPNANKREPDVVMLLDKHDPRRGPQEWSGADLAVEVVSPKDPDRDLVDKRREYAAAGVLEYWIVDPRPRTRSAPTGRTVTVLTLDGDEYVGAPVGEDGVARSALLEGFAVDAVVCLNPE